MSKESALNAYKRGLISMEIIQLKEMPETPEEADKIYDEYVKHKTYLIDDLSKPYIVRLSYTEHKSKINSVDPDVIPEGDMYELSESIQDILKENHFPIIESNFPEKEDTNE